MPDLLNQFGGTTTASQIEVCLIEGCEWARAGRGEIVRAPKVPSIIAIGSVWKIIDWYEH